MKTHATAPPAKRQAPLERAFGGLFGAFLSLALLKFGNPPIMEKFVAAPANIYELVLGYPWPISWAYLALGIVVLAGLAVARWRLESPPWIVILPLAWLGWQLLAATQTVDAELTAPTLKHFAACAVCFYVGLFCLNRAERLTWFWGGLFVGFLLMLAVGWEQHFGGLEQTRRYFYTYLYNQLDTVSPDYLKKISSNRIFATLFYPNTLAGSLLLLLPAMLVWLWRLGGDGRMTPAARTFLTTLGGVSGLGCLYWSGSKGGWLLMLFLGLVALMRLPFKKQLKIALVTGFFLAGLAGFFWKYSDFFQRGATSVSARFDYWRAALQTAAAKPLCGTGPGTFAIPYQAIKRPESEMARLVHNDYLQQASDSGLPGLLFYATFVVSALATALGRLKLPPAGGDAGGWLPFAVWLGVLGWAVQGLLEFGLYIPALAWPAFTFLGWLLSKPANPVDNAPRPR